MGVGGYRGGVVRAGASKLIDETEAQLITQSPMAVMTCVETWQQNLPFYTCTPLPSPARSQSVPVLTPSLLTGSSVRLEEVRKKEKIAVWEGEFVEPTVTLCKAKVKAAEKQRKVEKGKSTKRNAPHLVFLS